VLQLAVLLKVIPARKDANGREADPTQERVQKWADDNLGLDCNGFVGNYVFHDWMNNDWLISPPDDGKTPTPGPSAYINTLFHWASGNDEKGALDDLDQISPHLTYLVARVNDHGVVMQGGPNDPKAHIAITQPGEFMRQSFVHDSMGGLDPDFVNFDMYNHIALRTVESGGPKTGDLGLAMNWMVFVGPHVRNSKVFLVRRDRWFRADPDAVKIAPLPPRKTP
jgi:hypothetical protein